MSNVVRPYITIIAICLCVSVAPARAADTRSAMADAMVRMMEAMGLFGAAGGGVSGGSPAVPNPMGMSGWPSGFGAMPGVPGAGTMPFPGGSQMDPTSQMGQMGQMGQMMERFNPGSAMTGTMPWTVGPLEGLWEGSDDGLLIVQGARYRIYAPFSGYIDGDIRITGDRVELTNRRESFSQAFEYALNQGRLVLRDRQGQIYLYRRLVLEGG